jgi:hypothetical protein
LMYWKNGSWFKGILGFKLSSFGSKISSLVSLTNGQKSEEYPSKLTLFLQAPQV